MVSARVCCLALLAAGIADALKFENPDRHITSGYDSPNQLKEAAEINAIDEDGSPAAKLRWQGQGLILSKRNAQFDGEWTFDAAGVKDPSIVYYDGNWHVFYTGSDGVNGTVGYVKAPSLAELNNAPRYAIQMARGNNDPAIGWGVAPQIFYFEPHKKWYLLFQTRDTKFQPMVCTNSDISNPNGWSRPFHLLEKPANTRKWIDFWLVADDKDMYLFYTAAFRKKQVMFRKIPLPRFPYIGQRAFPDPEGWSEEQMAVEGVHEAAHIYKVIGKKEYHMVYEFFDSELGVEERLGSRSYRLAVAPSLAGPWSMANHTFARAEHMVFASGVEPWTDVISHGEAIRTGYNQNCEYDPKDGRWLIQGLNRADFGGNVGVPWALGIIKKHEIVERPMTDGRLYHA